MVATTFIAPGLDSKWLTYLGLSLLANLLIVSVISINKQPILSQEIPILKVNLMTVAAPAPEPVKQKVKQPPTPIATKKIVTERQAQKKVSVLKPEVIAKPVITNPKRVAEKIPRELAVLKPAAEIPSKNQAKQASTIIHEANYRRQTPPVYPRRALELGQEGTVTLHAEVTVAGLPRELKVAKSSGHRLLDMAALAAVKKWEFEPTNVNGNSITSWVRVPVRFVIQQ